MKAEPVWSTAIALADSSEEPPRKVAYTTFAPSPLSFATNASLQAIGDANTRFVHFAGPMSVLYAPEVVGKAAVAVPAMYKAPDESTAMAYGRAERLTVY